MDKIQQINTAAHACLAEDIGNMVLKVISDVRKYKSERNMSIKDSLETVDIYSNIGLNNVIEDIKNVCSITNVNVIISKDYSIKIK